MSMSMFFQTQSLQLRLGDFIEQMKLGWGFSHPGRVQKLGRALDKLIPIEDRDKMSRINYSEWEECLSQGWTYVYRWRIYDYRCYPDVSLIESVTDVLWGYSKYGDVFIDAAPDGIWLGYSGTYKEE